MVGKGDDEPFRSVSTSRVLLEHPASYEGTVIAACRRAKVGGWLLQEGEP